MATKKNLKKNINCICRNLFAEGVAAYLHSSSGSEKQYDEILSAILAMRNDFMSRMSHPEPGMPARQYFNTLKHDFEQQAESIIDRICNAQ